MVKKFGIIGSLLVATMVFAATAHADGITFGAKTGPMQVDGLKDDPTNAGVTVGNEFGIVLGDLGFEGEITTSMKDGENSFGQEGGVDTMGIYATYRSPGFVYLKARGGFLRWEGTGDFGGDGTETSLGLGIGFSLGLIQFELEYTQIEEDIDFISIGVMF